jgi:hypothetical protein
MRGSCREESDPGGQIRIKEQEKQECRLCFQHAETVAGEVAIFNKTCEWTEK